jgi:hypothetical protein
MPCAICGKADPFFGYVVCHRDPLKSYVICGDPLCAEEMRAQRKVKLV